MSFDNRDSDKRDSGKNDKSSESHNDKEAKNVVDNVSGADSSEADSSKADSSDTSNSSGNGSNANSGESCSRSNSNSELDEKKAESQERREAKLKKGILEYFLLFRDNIFLPLFSLCSKGVVGLISSVSVKISSHGRNMILLFALLAILLFLIGFGFIGLVLFSWCIYFFRDPERYTPEIYGNPVFSSADGKVTDIVLAQPPIETGIVDQMKRVSVFLDVFNVHVNRIPIKSKIKRIVYSAGKFFNASLNKSSLENERNTLVLEANATKECIIVTQIAGLIARRIVCTALPDSEMEAGERLGIIKFGSRVDIYLPADACVCVSLGQTMVGGESVIAFLSSNKNYSTGSTS